jgi:hypothetical protein
MSIITLSSWSWMFLCHVIQLELDVHLVNRALRYKSEPLLSVSQT